MAPLDAPRRVRTRQHHGAGVGAGWPAGRIARFYVVFYACTFKKSCGMKYAVSFLAFVCLAIANGQTTKSESDEVKEHLIKLEKQSWEAWKNRDSKFFQDFLSGDHVEVGFGGLTNKAQVVAVVGSTVCTVKSYKLDRFEVKMLDKDTALLTYWEEQDTVCNKQVPSPCWVSSLYMKRGDKWLNVFYQQTQIQK
jgi:hypothetical protein